MKKKNIFLLLLVFIISINTVSFGEKGKSEDIINIVFTHDLHDHIEDFNVVEDGEIINIGGFERLNNRIKKEREKDKDLLVLDAGDYSMGSLFQTIYSTDSPSLRLLGEMGYDATTFGNHEFDFKTKGLTDSLKALKKSKDQYPQIVASNIDFKNYEGVDRSEVEDLEKAFKDLGADEYTVLEKKGLRIGVFGLLGKEAISNAPMAGVNFKDPIESAKEVVSKLKKENVDLIIALSHSGTWEEKKKSEDEILAKKVDGIDLIISGHTHTKLDSPIVVNDTIIASSGRYTENIGILQLKREKDKAWKLTNYEIEPLREEIKERELDKKILGFKKKVQTGYLDRFNFGYNEVLGRSDFNFTPAKDIGKTHGEDPLANLISDSFIHIVKKIEGEDYKELAASIVPAGTIRDSFTKGDITVSDVFNANSLGIGPDNISGYPLIEVYLTGKDLKTAAEVDASIAPLMPEAQLYMSGLSYKFNPNRLIFNKITDIHLLDEDGGRLEIVDDKLYRVVAGLYTGQMLSIVKDQSFGLLSIVPRDESGREIVNLEDHIIYDGEEEVKEWYAVADYISSFDKKLGKANIPKKYSQPEGRKIVDNRKSIKNKFMKPNSFAKKVYLLIALLVLVLVFLVRFIYRKIRRKIRRK